MTQPWFRFYRAALNNPKVQKLPAPLFKAWVNILCCTDDEGDLPKVADLEFMLRASGKQVNDWLSGLNAAGLVEFGDDDLISVYGWDEHQRKGDTSNERVKRYRERTRNVTGNAPERDTETEEDTEAEKGESAQAAPRPTKGTRLPANWAPQEDADIELAERLLGNRAQGTLEKFRDYWAAKAGAGGVKADWSATWRNWVRREAEGNTNGGKSSNRTQASGQSLRDIQLAAALASCRE